MSAIGADAKELPRQRGGLRRGYYRPGKERSGGGFRPVYSKVYTTAPIRARGKKRASQEAWPKGLGHWDWITSTGATSSISNGCDGGWTVGGGFEYGFTPYLSAGVEYSFTRINIGDRSRV